MKKHALSLTLAVLFLFITAGLAMGFSTYAIRDDATGGDCALFGLWDPAAKTCTMTSDLYTGDASPAITIDSDLTLDGNGHSITSAMDEWGRGKEGIRILSGNNITVKNMHINNYSLPIYVRGSVWKIAGQYVITSGFNNRILDNNIKSGRSDSGIFFNRTANSVISGNTIGTDAGGGFYYDEGGVYLFWGENSVVSGNTIRGYRGGITLSSRAKNNIISGNDISGNENGIMLWVGTINNIIEGNIVYSNEWYGITVFMSKNNVLRDNTVFNNRFGVRIVGGGENCSGNLAYNNNLINNLVQVYNTCPDAVFSLDAPIGGNYWSDFDTPEEGCYDANADGFCDSPYYVKTDIGVDYLPYSKQDGWKTPTIGSLMEKVNSLYAAKEITNRGIHNSLMAKLKNALAAESQGDISGAIDLMGAFINQVEAQSGKHISAEGGAELIEMAQKILESLST